LKLVASAKAGRCIYSIEFSYPIASIPAQISLFMQQHYCGYLILSTEYPSTVLKKRLSSWQTAYSGWQYTALQAQGFNVSHRSDITFGYMRFLSVEEDVNSIGMYCTVYRRLKQAKLE
jgi:hypothetical protein